MRCTKRVDDPTAVFVMSNQCADADDRVINVLWELLAHGGANFIVALAVMTIGGGKSLEVGNRFDIPNDDAGSRHSHTPASSQLHLRAAGSSNEIGAGCSFRACQPLSGVGHVPRHGSALLACFGRR